MQDPTLRKPPVYLSAKKVPIEPVLLTPAAECSEPNPGHLSAKGLDAVKIAWNRVVVHVSLHDRSKPLAQFEDGFMEPAA